MLRFLPLFLLLAACGDDPAPVVVSDTDIAVVETPTEVVDMDGTTDADGIEDGAAEAPLDAAPVDAPPAPAAATPTPPAPAPTPTPDPVLAENDARSGSIDDALLAASWKVVNGPDIGAKIYFENDGSYQIEGTDGVTDGGEWTVEEGVLYFGASDAHVISERRTAEMSFDDGSFVIAHNTD